MVSIDLCNSHISDVNKNVTQIQFFNVMEEQYSFVFGNQHLIKELTLYSVVNGNHLIVIIIKKTFNPNVVFIPFFNGNPLILPS